MQHWLLGVNKSHSLGEKLTERLPQLWRPKLQDQGMVVSAGVKRESTPCLSYFQVSDSLRLLACQT